MPKGIVLFICCLLFSVAALAGVDDLEIQLVNTNVMKLLPGSTSNIVVKLINHTETDKDFILKIDTPQGWKCLTNFGTVAVERTNTKLKILGIYIPEFTNSENYAVRIHAYDKMDNHRIGTINIPFYVQPVFKIFVDAYQAPGYVVSGDSLTVKFMVKNLSNAEAEIKTSIKGPDRTVDQLFILAPDSLVIVGKTFVVNTNSLNSNKKHISLEASIIGKPETKIIKYHYFDLITSNKTRFDPYERFPVKISSLLVTNNRSGVREYAAMYDIRGMGLLNKKTKSMLDFHFRGPNRIGKSLLGIYDENYIKYRSSHTDMVVGDNNYKLTYLTEQSRYGRGIGYKYLFKNLHVGSFVNYPRFYPHVKREFSFYTGYSSSEEKYKINAGYLNKQFETNTTAHLITVSGVVSAYNWIDLEMEYATGIVGEKQTHAYQTAIKANYTIFRMFFNYTMADKDFPGYFSSSEYLATGLSARISRKINLNINYNFNHNNIALDTLYSNAPFSENLSFSANYGINKTTGLNLSWDQRERDDRMTPKKFHYTENTIRISLNKKVQRLGINVRGETGKTTNLLSAQGGQLTSMYKANLILRYRFNDHLFMNGFINYNKYQRYNTTDNLSWYYGGSLDASAGEKVSVTLNYQNNYEMEEYYRDRSIFSLNGNYKITRNNEIGVLARYNLARNTMDKRELELMIRFTHTIHVPVRKKKDLGTLRGRIINKGVDNIEGIVITVEGNMAVTDKNGFFKFPVVKTGIQYLMVDYKNAGLFAIAEIPGPYRVNILPGIDNSFELSLTRSVKVSGNIEVENDENNGDKEFLAVKAKLNSLLIEAKNGAEVYRVLTDEKGNFSFEGLRPGNWSIQVHKNGIPKEYELLTEFFSLNLESGKNETIQVKVREKQRRIKFQRDL